VDERGWGSPWHIEIVIEATYTIPDASNVMRVGEVFTRLRVKEGVFQVGIPRQVEGAGK
jgi:hypothetical protein